MHFWLNRGGLDSGPYPLPQLIAMANAGTVATSEPVRHLYGTTCVPLGQLLELPRFGGCTPCIGSDRIPPPNRCRTSGTFIESTSFPGHLLAWMKAG